MVIAAIFGGIIAYANGFFSPESLSLSLPWWGWPLFWVVVIAGLLAYRIFTVFRGKDTTAPTKGAIVRTAATVQAPAAPTQQAAPAKPKGFNASVGGRSAAGLRAGATRERTPILERLGLSALREMGMVVWLVPVGVVLLAVVGYFCWQLMTMEWIDAEGYPISKPWWVWVLPFALLALGAITWKVVLVIRENREDSAFRSSRPTPQNKPQQKPRGFNMQPPGKRK